MTWYSCDPGPMRYTIAFGPKGSGVANFLV